jgi:hypothetical protein
MHYAGRLINNDLPFDPLSNPRMRRSFCLMPRTTSPALHYVGTAAYSLTPTAGLPGFVASR